LNPDDPNVLMVQTVAQALGPLRHQVVFLGGCATGLLVTDPARPPVRATQDVDVVTEVRGRGEYYQLSEALRKLGFREDVGEVICRWRLRELVVDVMPTDESILGFSNRWYGPAVRESLLTRLPDGTEIHLVSPPLLMATKLEAFYGRGQGDYGVSHDIEDIVTLVDGRAELIGEIAAAGADLREYLRDEVDDLLAERSFTDTLSWHLGPGAGDQGRVDVVIERLRKIAGI